MGSTGVVKAPLVSAWPTGGTVGQVLTKRTSADYDLLWATSPTAAVLAWPAGSFYDNRHSLPAGGSSTITFPNGTFFVPIWIPVPVTATGLRLYIGATAPAAFKMGLYAISAATAGPGTLLGSGTTGTPAVNAAVSVAVTATALTPGWYFVAYTGSGTGVAAGFPTDSSVVPFGFTPGGPATAFSTIAADALAGPPGALASNPTFTRPANTVTPLVWIATS